MEQTYPIIENLKHKLIKEIKEKLLLNIDFNDNNFKNLSINFPKNKQLGDLATNAAFTLAGLMSISPLKAAELLVEIIISKWDEAEKVSIAAPGFINFFINKKFLIEQLKIIALKKEKYGQTNQGQDIKIQIEFVSANPTGDLHIGHGRWAALGDSLCNIYEANGFNVWREYYVNDYGTQIKIFTECVISLYLKAFNIKYTYPKEGYPKNLVQSVVQEIISKYNDKFLNDIKFYIKHSVKSAVKSVVKSDIESKIKQDIKLNKNSNINSDINAGIKQDNSSGNNLDSNSDIEPHINLDSIEKFQQLAIDIMIDRISSTLLSMGVSFDKWFKESSLYKNLNFDKILKELDDKNLVYEKDGALWFKTSEYGDDKDRVIVRSGGEPTYFASDIMYLLNKKSRGFDKLIYILGADHHGYVKRIHAIGKAFNFDDEKIKIIIGQLVRLVKKGKAVKMSKRKGKIFSLKDLIDDVGRDAIRYFFSLNSFDTPMDFDIALAKKKSNTNPVYYVQYAHARIANVFNKMLELYLDSKLVYDKNRIEFSNLLESELGKDLNNSDFLNNLDFLERISKKILDNFNYDELNLKNDDEVDLAKFLIFYPDTLLDACLNDAPYLVNQYLYKLANKFHYFYKHNRIIDQQKLNIDRLILILTVRVVLANAMKILGVSTPIKM